MATFQLTDSCVSHYGGWFSRNAPRTDSQLRNGWVAAVAVAAASAWFAEFIWPPAVATSWFDYLLLIFFVRSWPRYKRPTMPPIEDNKDRDEWKNLDDRFGLIRGNATRDKVAGSLADSGGSSAREPQFTSEFGVVHKRINGFFIRLKCLNTQ